MEDQKTLLSRLKGGPYAREGVKLPIEALAAALDTDNIDSFVQTTLSTISKHQQELKEQIPDNMFQATMDHWQASAGTIKVAENLSAQGRVDDEDYNVIDKNSAQVKKVDKNLTEVTRQAYEVFSSDTRASQKLETSLCNRASRWKEKLSLAEGKPSAVPNNVYSSPA